MNGFSELLGSKLHHAYLIEATDEGALESLADLIEKKLSFTRLGNPDFIVISYDTFGIDESHSLIRLQSQTAESGRKYILISAGKITTEAQNALLKVFEEPTPGTHFFVILPTLQNILPTLRSRVYVFSARNSSEDIDVPKFVSLSLPERLLWLEQLTEHPEDEGEKTKKQKAISNLLNNLEILVSNLDSGDAKMQAVGSIIEARKYLNDTAPSHKLLLGNLALSFPVL